MTTASAADQISLVSTTIMKSQVNKKRPGHIVVSQSAKKRRALVSRTHSLRNEPCHLSSPNAHKPPRSPHQTIRLHIRKLAPTVLGVAEAARLMGNGKVVVLPTETVYTACTFMFPQQQQSAEEAVSNLRMLCCQGEPFLISQRPIQTLERFIPFSVKPYAIKKTDGQAITPVIFSERKEILYRLAKKFWPGPVIMYVRSDTYCTIPKCSRDDTKFIGLSNPSHPLTNRLLKETLSSEDSIVVGMVPRTKSETFMTTATDVCSYFSSEYLEKEQAVHVLNGEDKRELFSVPTCQYGKPCGHSFWIDESIRTVFIRGTSDDSLKRDSVILCLLAESVSPGDEEKTRNRNRVMTAVIRKWKVVDERLNA